MLISVINFEAFPTESLYGAILEFDEAEEDNVGYNFAGMGYGSSNFILNLGPVFIYLCLIIFLCLIFGLVLRSLRKFKKVDKVYKWFSKKFFFNGLLRLVLEIYIEILIAGFLTIKNPSLETSGGLLSFILGIVSTLLCLIMPIITFMVVYSNRLVLDST